MFSPHSGDDMLAQVWNWSEYLSTYFTGEISFVLSFLFQYMANEAMNKIRKSQKEKKKNFWLTGEGARDATTSKQNGAANVRKIGRRYHKIFRSRCPGGICTNTEMTHEFLGGGGGVGWRSCKNSAIAPILSPSASQAGDSIRNSWNVFSPHICLKTGFHHELTLMIFMM